MTETGPWNGSDHFSSIADDGRGFDVRYIKSDHVVVVTDGKLVTVTTP